MPHRSDTAYFDVHPFRDRLAASPLEARDRLGGRVQTIQEPGWPLPIELGAEFIHGYDDATAPLLDAAGLVATDVDVQRHRLASEKLRQSASGYTPFKSFMALARRSGARSMGEVLERTSRDRRLAAAVPMLRGFIEGFNAADPDDLSAEEFTREGDGALGSGSRVVNGYGRLVDWLAAGLHVSDALLLGMCVTHVTRNRSGVEIVARSTAGLRTAECIAALYDWVSGALAGQFVSCPSSVEGRFAHAVVRAETPLPARPGLALEKDHSPSMQNLLPLSARFRHIVVARGARLRKIAFDCKNTEHTIERVTEAPHSEPGESQLFCQWLFEKAGLDARAYRPETLLRRLPACLRELRVRTIAQARRELELEPALCSVAVSTILIGVTSFFRDPGVFTCVTDQLPIVAGTRRSVQVWSIGCSGGEELYSVALLLAELGLLEGSYLLGTDCRPEAIESAKSASYDAMSIKNVPVSFRQRYFVEQNQRWHLKQSIAAAARWRTENILGAHQPGIWDLILCRNTTMYMVAQATSTLWERFESSLRVGGLLVLGKAERPLGSKRLVALSPCVYRKARV